MSDRIWYCEGCNTPKTTRPSEKIRLEGEGELWFCGDCTQGDTP